MFFVQNFICNQTESNSFKDMKEIKHKTHEQYRGLLGNDHISSYPVEIIIFPMEMYG